jgi:hypothetical protein
VTSECSALVVNDTNCVNVTVTQWSINDMNVIAQALVAPDASVSAADAMSPIPAGWINPR